ncbi:MAG: site-specific integrase [Synergistaceae bacterium]|jgi:integrase|nr:site-specific integrase [Synergistaceae bacterium]
MEVEPIKTMEEVAAMKAILKYKKRDALLFVMGINTALRIGDLLSLSIGDVLNDKGKIVAAVRLKEQKTGKEKRFPLNKSVQKALSAYLKQCGSNGRKEPLFPSQKGGPLSRWQAWRILRAAGKSIGLENIGTHSLRKTFGYHVYKNNGGDIGLVQKLLNHSASSCTLRYIGIDRERMDKTYMDLNL